MGGRTILRWDRLLDRARHRPAVRSFSAAGAGRVPLLLAIPNPPGEGALEDGRRFFHSPAFDQRPRVASDRRSAAGLHKQATVERVAPTTSAWRAPPTTRSRRYASGGWASQHERRPRRRAASRPEGVLAPFGVDARSSAYNLKQLQVQSEEIRRRPRLTRNQVIL